MESSVSLQALELILKDISTAVASLDEQDVTIGHIVEVFPPVSAYLAHNLLKEVVSGYAFFSFLSVSSISGFTTEGTSYQLWRN